MPLCSRPTAPSSGDCIDAGLTRWRAALAPYQGTRAVVAHESWPYFARRFGLTVVSGVRSRPRGGLPPSAAYLAALTGRMEGAPA